MITVEPESTVTQHRHDVVLYELKFAHWNADLSRAKEGKITALVQRGAPLVVKTLPYQVGSHAQTIRVLGGSSGGRYEIVRTVTDKEETRRRSFLLRVT